LVLGGFPGLQGSDAFDKIKTAEENASKSNTLDVRMERRIEHLAE
jgi:hypothetical protein